MEPDEPINDGPVITEPAAVSYLMGRATNVPVRALLGAGPRAMRFLVRSATRDFRFPEQLTNPEIPTRLPSIGTATGVWLDELILAVMATTRLMPDAADLDRIADEVATAIATLDASGALDDPRLLHPAPSAPAVTESTNETYRGIRYEHRTHASEYQPAIDLPGTDRWNAVEANRTAHTYVLRHREPRPWLIQLHGFGMGKPSDLVAMRSLHFHRDFGLNVVQPVFPTHGPRADRSSGQEALTLDYVNNVHAVSQALREVRQTIAWIRSIDDQPIAVHGVSMGGYLTGLLAGFEPDLGAVIAGVPTADLAWAMKRHVPEEERLELDARGLLGRPADQIHQVISPLAVDLAVDADHCFVYAGVADRMATPGQAYRLWNHWGQPSVLWYRGAHVGFAWSGEVQRFVDRALTQTGFNTRSSR